MPALPPVHGVVKTVVNGTVATEPFVNIFYWLMDDLSGLNNSQALQIATGTFNSYNTNMMSQFPTNVTLRSVQAIDLTSSTGGVAIFASTGAGTGGSNIGAAQNCVLVSHKIARRYRGGHPRTYFPSPSSINLQDPQHWTTTLITTFQTKYNAFVTGVIGTVVTGNTIDNHVSVSFRSGGGPRAIPVVDVISSSVAEVQVATQRRRTGR